MKTNLTEQDVFILALVPFCARQNNTTVGIVGAMAKHRFPQLWSSQRGGIDCKIRHGGVKVIKHSDVHEGRKSGNRFIWLALEIWRY